MYQDVVGTDCADDRKQVQNQSVSQDKLIVENAEVSATVTSKWAKQSGGPSESEMGCMLLTQTPIAHAFKIRGGSETETGEQGGVPVIGFSGRDNGQDASENTSPTLRTCANPTHDRSSGWSAAIAYETNPTDARVSEIKDGVGPTVKARWGTGGNNQALVQQVTYERHDQDGRIKQVQISPTIHSKSDNACDLPLVQSVTAIDWRTAKVDEDITQTLKTDLAKMSGPCISHQTMAFEPESIARNAEPSDLSEVSPTLRREMGDNQPAMVAPPLTASNNPSRSPQSSEVTQQVQAVHLASMAVRRLTPVECERLQGFPDGWTQITWRKKPAEDCPDGPRYKAIGNSMAVNVMQWIGLRIAMFEELEKDL